MVGCTPSDGLPGSWATNTRDCTSGPYCPFLGDFRGPEGQNLLLAPSLLVSAKAK